MALLILAHLYLQIHYPKIHIIYDLGKLACLQLYECYLSHPLPLTCPLQCCAFYLESPPTST